jgi:hypothetical protein
MPFSTPHRDRALIAIALTSLLANPNSFAQERPTAEQEALENKLDEQVIKIAKDSEIHSDELKGALDLAVPENPLFTLMGTTPETVIRPKAGDQVAAAIAPQAANAFGNEAFAIAFEMAPAQFIMPNQFTISEWKGNALKGQDGREIADAQGLTSAQRVQRLRRAKFIEPLTLTIVANRSNEAQQKTQFGFGASYIFDTGAPLRKQARFEDCLEGESEQRKALLAKVSLIRQQAYMPAYARAAAKFLFQQKATKDAQNDDRGLRTYLKNQLGVEAFKDETTTTVIIEAALRDQRERSVKLSDISLSTIHNLLPPDLALAVTDETFVIGSDSDEGRMYNAAAYKAAKDCAEEIRPWNRNIYGAGLAIYHSSTAASDPSAPNSAPVTSPADATEEDVADVTGFGAWSSIALKAANFGQLTLHARYTDDLVRERGSGDKAVTERVDSWSVAGRYTQQFSASKNQKSPKANAIRGFLEAAYVEEDFSGISDTFWQAGIGAEVQLRKDLFVQFVVGDTFGSQIDRSNYLSGQIKWSFTKLPASSE